MTIDIFSETIITLSEAAKQLPCPGGMKPIGVAAVRRWAKSGMPCPDDEVAILETFKLRGRVCTSREALQRFFLSATTPTHQSWL
ncbi:MAG: hypothetical protein ACYC0X_31505 [Pirellulaceae bacterium]